LTAQTVVSIPAVADAADGAGPVVEAELVTVGGAATWCRCWTCEVCADGAAAAVWACAWACTWDWAAAACWWAKAAEAGPEMLLMDMAEVFLSSKTRIMR
jgi:hypothetical protein